MNEEWADVTGVGVDGLRVSSLGSVVSFRRGRQGRILKQWVGHKGYVYVSTSGPVKRTMHLKVHRLVGSAFIGELPQGMVTRHLDGDKTNNAVTNLAYGTPAENSADVVAHGGNYQSRRTHCPLGHEYDSANTYISPKGHRGCRICRNDAAKRYVARGAEAAGRIG